MTSSSSRARSWYAKCGVAGPTSASTSSLVGWRIARSLTRELRPGRSRDVHVHLERAEGVRERPGRGRDRAGPVERDEPAVAERRHVDRRGRALAAAVDGDHVEGAVVLARTDLDGAAGAGVGGQVRLEQR